MILDQLIKKKDLMAYIDLRIKYLKSTATSEYLKVEPKKREITKQKINGQIKELKKLRKIIYENKTKETSKKIYRILEKMEK